MAQAAVQSFSAAKSEEGTKLGISTGILFSVALLSLMLWVWASFQGSHSSFITHTNPVHGNPKKPVYGYSYFYNGDLFHKENFYPLKQMNLIKRGDVAAVGKGRSFTDRRFFHAVMGNWFTTVLNPVWSLRVLNLFLYLSSALLLILFTTQLGFSPLKGWLAAFLFALSPPAVMFVGDLSPHMLGIFFYFLFAYLLAREWSKEEEKFSWRSTIGISSVLALWAASYPSAGYGAAVFFLALLFTRQWLKSALPVLTMLAMPRLQLGIISLFGGEYGANTEALYFQKGFLAQWGVLTGSPSLYFHNTGKAFLNFLFVDNPWTILLSLVGLFFVPRGKRLLISLLIFVPVAIVMPVYTTSSARAYIVSCIAVAMLPLAAHGFLTMFEFWKCSLVDSQFFSRSLRIHPEVFTAVGVLAALVFLVFPLYAHKDSQDMIQWGVGILLVPFLFLFLPPLQKLCCRFSGIRWGVMAMPLVFWLGVHACWGLAPMFQRVVPAFALAQGVFAPLHPFDFKAEYMAHSGEKHDFPASLGGKSSWYDAVRVPKEKQEIPVFTSERVSWSALFANGGKNFFTSIAFQILLVLFAGLALFCFFPLKIWLPATTFLLALCVSATLFGSKTALNKKYASYLDQNIVLHGEHKLLHGRLYLSNDFHGMLRKFARRKDVVGIDIYLNMTKLKRGKVSFTIPAQPIEKSDLIGVKKEDRQIELKDFPLRERSRLGNVRVAKSVPFISFIDSNAHVFDYLVEFDGETPLSSVYLGSWRRCKRKERVATVYDSLGGEEKLDWCPSLEIRVRHKRWYYTLIGM